MHYVGFFDHAAWQLISALGFTRTRLEQERRGFVDVTSTIQYQAEQHAGGLKRMGNTSITVLHRMLNNENGELAATLETVMLYFDPEARRKVPLPEADKSRLAEFLIRDQEET